MPNIPKNIADEFPGGTTGDKIGAIVAMGGAVGEIDVVGITVGAGVGLRVGVTVRVTTGVADGVALSTT